MHEQPTSLPCFFLIKLKKIEPLKSQSKYVSYILIKLVYIHFV